MSDPGPADRSHPDTAAVARAIIEDARRVTGGGSLLAARLQSLGFAPPDSGQYSESAISNWVRGRTMPPADVLLAAAFIAGISVDEQLLKPAGVTQDEASADAIARMQVEIDDLQSDVSKLYGLLGYASPEHGRRPKRSGRSS